MPRLKREANFSFMLIGLLIMLVVGPITLELNNILAAGDNIVGPDGSKFDSGLVIQTIFVATMVISIWSVVESPLWTAVGIALAAITFISSLSGWLDTGIFWLELIGLTAMFLFCVLNLAFTMGHLFDRPTVINTNRLIGAISVYLLLGIGFGVLNMAIEMLLPGSFRGADLDGDGSSGIDLIYFSFVTMTTLGYGDVTPIRPVAQAFSYIGAVAGQFYIAVLVAGIVGAYINANIHKKDD
ncbi:MAG: potassium channel family protein [Gammaproteobacteria bacterium]